MNLPENASICTQQTTLFLETLKEKAKTFPAGTIIFPKIGGDINKQKANPHSHICF